ncbi:PREDICTED: protein bicaudal C homolog 1-like [Amphimedon queenslandica]|uniref:K Homology domain-containing protein n=1 Tax=Amphimedon queenslandica TaxID=400682 RepID=A0AAN0JS12_AMPQE|nr:PREDICTED: protein bicaudal C homolog 1-like [Amphimedon queenslandica]|eukprot:XP_019859608.1 PREDICTED: protein bicaudal C homolog 1-like [Amphimedon queenslandica]
MMVSIRSSMRFLDGLKLAVVKVIEYITGDYPPITEVTLFADIAVQHQRTVMGIDGGNLQDIMHETCTSIHFPDPHSRYRSSQISIIGGLENVFDARQRIMGCLPVAILFDVIDESEQLTSGYLGELMQSLDIYISMKPKGKNYIQVMRK